MKLDPDQIAAILDTQTVDGTASTNSYIVFARDKKTGAYLGIRPLGIGMFRLRMMPSQTLGFTGWGASFPKFKWTKSNGTRKSLVDGAMFQEPEHTENPRQSFLNSRLTGQLASALKARIEEADAEMLCDIDALADLIIKHWADQFGYNDTLYDEIERLKRIIETTPGDLSHIQKKIDDLIAEHGEPVTPDAPPLMLKKAFFEQPESEEHVDAITSQATTEKALSDATPDDQEPETETPTVEPAQDEKTVVDAADAFKSTPVAADPDTEDAPTPA